MTTRSLRLSRDDLDRLMSSLHELSEQAKYRAVRATTDDEKRFYAERIPKMDELHARLQAVKPKVIELEEEPEAEPDEEDE